jgi:hypothetical protein
MMESVRDGWDTCIDDWKNLGTASVISSQYAQTAFSVPNVSRSIVRGGPCGHYPAEYVAQLNDTYTLMIETILEAIKTKQKDISISIEGNPYLTKEETGKDFMDEWLLANKGQADAIDAVRSILITTFGRQPVTTYRLASKGDNTSRRCTVTFSCSLFSVDDK